MQKNLGVALFKSISFAFLAIYVGADFISELTDKIAGQFSLDCSTFNYFAFLIWALFLLIIVARFIDKQKISSYGLHAKSFKQGLTEFYDGALIGSTMVTTVTLILFIFGLYEPLAINYATNIIYLIPGLTAAAFFEELVFRGYVLQTIERASTAKTAVIISSLLFGAAHINNFHQNVPLLNQIGSCTALGLDAGLLFAAAYFYTRRLWLATGLHTFWNVFEGPVFGTPVSGYNLGIPLITSQLQGPSLLTGGVFGPEASLVELTVCLLLAWAIWRRKVGAGPVS